MIELNTLYSILDLAGTFAFAISGALAAKQRGLDLFGIVSIAFVVACGGGILRDLCIGAIPPAGLTDWHFLTAAIIAALMTVWLSPLVERLQRPVLLFDALGLSLFTVFGTHKALLYGQNAEAAVLLGITTAVGGGVLRDVLLNRVPVILEREIYASAALLGALIVLAGDYLKLPDNWVSIAAISGCSGLRFLAIRYRWNLPAFTKEV
jgi:uncharacterized membrane protein YeiH